MNAQIDTDGTTVWINSTIDGSCIARFGRMGIDIHMSFSAQRETGVECLQCTHGETTAQDWETFKAGMLTHYKIVVTDKHKPKRFRAS